jgi:hypothetical protein
VQPSTYCVKSAPREDACLIHTGRRRDSTLTLLISVVLSLVILWAVRTHMPPPLRLVLSALIVVILLVALLSVFGWFGPLLQPIGSVGSGLSLRC